MTAAVVSGVTLLNATFETISIEYPLKKAARLLSLGKAIVHEDDGSGRMFGTWPFPKVLRLVEYVKIGYEALHGPPQISKRGVLQRDNYECAYCGEAANTVDHIVPKCDGGKTTWMNLVACCFRCNQIKGNRPLKQCRMKLRKTPYTPKRKMR